MDIWISALQTVFTPTTLFFIAFGVLLGTVLGAIPGLNSTMGTALLIPFTFAMEPANGLALLAAVYCGGTFGGSISAILFNVPGAPEAAATGFDGYPISNLEFIDCLAQCNDGSRIFMTRDKTSIGRLPWPGFCRQAQIRAAYSMDFGIRIPFIKDDLCYWYFHRFH